ncbi:MAG: sugar phosphate nucleotidyltransferase, partial [Caldimonas sp.]
MTDAAPIEVVPVVLAGGSGTRLWPLSRALHPKQYLAITGKETLFQMAALRLAALDGAGFAVAPPCVVANEEHRFTVVEQLRAIGVTGEAILLEPVGRNTAPALALAALQANQGGADPVLVVTPADHAITNAAACT